MKLYEVFHLTLNSGRKWKGRERVGPKNFTRMGRKMALPSLFLPFSTQFSNLQHMSGLTLTCITGQGYMKS